MSTIDAVQGQNKEITIAHTRLNDASGLALSSEVIVDLPNHIESVKDYAAFRASDNSALCIGLFEEDLEAALEDDRTVLLHTTNEQGIKTKSPILVPVDILQWYNHGLFKNMYGSRQVYAYVHPDNKGGALNEAIEAEIARVIGEGGVIVTEKYTDDADSPIATFIDIARENGLIVEDFGDKSAENTDDYVPSRVDFFAGEAKFNDRDPFAGVPVIDIYETLVKSGEITIDEFNGILLERVIDGDQAERLWELYKKPFDDLGKNDPTAAGFSRDMFMDILADETVAKAVNKVDGEITTLLLFIDDLSRAPWFNSAYYEEHYPEYFSTRNILMSPGVVSDEAKRGNNYAVALLEFLSGLYEKRGSNVLLTFECTQISTTYIPAIVTGALNKPGVCDVSGFDKPLGSIEYFGISANI